MRQRGRGVVSDGGKEPLQRVLEALSIPHCRYLCYYLVENEPADVEECAAAVAARETDRPPSEVPASRCEDVEAMLVHNHLPRLADLRIVEYDPRSGAVRYRDPPPHFERFLELAREIETE